MDQRALTISQFGTTAANYLTSPVHANGADLGRLTELARSRRMSSVLDLGCGAGHASFALLRAGLERVIAYDLASEMLEVVAHEAYVRGHAHLETRQGPAERLDFADDSLDMVVTRYSAHHWLDVRSALREVARVLKSGGVFVVIDVTAPENPLLDTVLQTVEFLRDQSHVRDYRESEWRAMLLDSEFPAPQSHGWRLPMEFDSWVARIGTAPARIQALKTVFDALPTEARDYFRVTDTHSFAIDATWLQTVRQ